MYHFASNSSRTSHPKVVKRTLRPSGTCHCPFPAHLYSSAFHLLPFSCLTPFLPPSRVPRIRTLTLVFPLPGTLCLAIRLTCSFSSFKYLFKCHMLSETSLTTVSKITVIFSASLAPLNLLTA